MQKFAYALIFTILTMGAAGALLSSRFQNLFSSTTSGPQTLLHVSQLLLLGVWVVLVALWIGATVMEFRLWQQHLSVILPTIQAYAAMIVLAVTLGLMPVLIVFDPRWFTGYYALFLLVNLWTQHVTNTHFARALEKTRKELGHGGRSAARRTREKILDVMDLYWLKRPQLGRIAVMAGIATGAFAISVYAATKTGSAQDLWSAVSLALVFLVIVVGEVVINSWRGQRHKDLRPILG